MPRLDAPGVLHHIIIRGIERRNIFLDDQDREDFLRRLEKLLPETQASCYAWAFLPNHAHFLLRTGQVPLPSLMTRLLTGYVVSFNRRHQRHGHLFQNRYRSIVCQEDVYFRELIRYIHLNPLRAGLVPDLTRLNGYSYCGHSALVGLKDYPWQDVGYVLGCFGERLDAARGSYLAYMREGKDQGSREDLISGGWVRSMVGWSEAGRPGIKVRDRRKSDERILGDSDFVDSILAQADESLDRHFQLRRRGLDLQKVAERVAEIYQIDSDQLYSRGRQQARVQARSLFCFWAAKELGLSLTTLAEHLGMSPAGVGYAVQRGEAIAQKSGYRLGA
jgi:REP element-mobilizing transposase RayT